MIYTEAELRSWVDLFASSGIMNFVWDGKSLTVTHTGDWPRRVKSTLEMFDKRLQQIDRQRDRILFLQFIGGKQAQMERERAESEAASEFLYLH